MGRRYGGRIHRLVSCGLIPVVTASVLTGCRVMPSASPAPVVVAEASPTAAPSSAPAVLGLSDRDVASLESLVQVDDYPLYVMHLYDTPPASGVQPPHSFPAVAGEGRPGWACSLFAAMGDPEHSLYGRNFDWSYSPGLLLFNHPAEGYDSVSMVDLAYFYDEDQVHDLADAPLEDRVTLLETEGWPFDGMNEMGLAVGMAAVPDDQLPRDATLPTIGSLGLIRELLDHAATVDEAEALMRGYNVDMEGGPAVHYLVADAGRDTALVEFYQGEVVALANSGLWHLATNHYRAPLSADDTGGCWRYGRLDEVLTAASGNLTVVDAQVLLSEVAQPSTQWSIVYDMSARVVHVAMGQGHTQAHTFDMEGD